MREAFNQPQKVKPKQGQQQYMQLSQRSMQPHHQKTNSMTNKVHYPLQQQLLTSMMAYDEQQLQQLPQQQQNQATMNSQPSGSINQFHQSINIGGQLTKVQPSPNPQSLGVGGGHKKSNSLINSKMAQILMKGVAPGGMMAHCNNQYQGAPVTIGNISNIANPIYYQQQQQQHLIQDPKSLKTHHQVNQNNTSNSIAAGATVSHQTSFHHQNDMISYSIDYNKGQFYDEYEDPSNQNSQLHLQNVHQQQQQLFMNQVPSSKQIITNNIPTKQQSLNMDVYLQQQQPNPIGQNLADQSQNQIKKQMTGGSQKSAGKGSSAQKISKKSIVASGGGGGHQRTKSDTYYNRGSITAKQNIGSSQQQKRMPSNNILLKNNFVETQDSRQMVHQNNNNINNSKNTAYIMLSSDGPARKAPGSAHHSKKPSNAGSSNTTTVTSLNQNQIIMNNQANGKKSTREKYIELKALYNDLLERHYVQQQQYQQLSSKGLPGGQSNSNLINFYPPSIGQQQQHNIETQNSTTPRITMTNQVSQSTINANIQLLNQELQAKQKNQAVSKTIKHQSSKMDPAITLQQAQLQQQQQLQLQPKAQIKLQLAQGVSRKVVGPQGNHKRSVSDGNEQLFKFKQQAAMQRYLYPQPSNQTLQVQQTACPQNTQNTEETLQSSRSKGGIYLQNYQQQQAPNHQRRVSDDYNQKQKKSQLHLQNQLIGSQSSVMNNGIKQQNNQSQLNNPQMVIVENVPNDFPGENQKPATVDFNIKGFLLEMRNKHEKQGQGFINIVDEQQQQILNNSPSQVSQQQQRMGKHGKQFAMIIEENSPTAMIIDDQALYHGQHLGTLDSSRKMSLVDSQSQMLLQSNLLSQNGASKPNIEFNKILQKYKQMRIIDDNNSKRSQSPSLDPKSKKKILPQGAGHKRVKSDIPEMPRKQQQAQQPQQHINFQPLASKASQQNKKISHQASGGHIFNSDKNTPKKQQFSKGFPAFQIGGGGAQFEASGSKKVINVSIDLIKDAADLDNSGMIIDDSSSHGGGHWVIMDSSSQNLDLKKKVNKQGSHGQFIVNQQFSGGNVDGLRQDKYKKMKQKYQGEQQQPQAVMDMSGINKNNRYTFDQNIRSASNNSPMQSSPKGRFSIDKKQPIPQQSPKQKQTSKFKVHNLVAQQAAITQKKNPKKEQSKQIIQQQQQPQPIVAAPPNNSVVQTQESARNSILLTTNAHLNLNGVLGERLDTQDSTVSDPNLSPRTKGIHKLIKHIKLSFRQTQLAPNTTVDFYRIGKVLGKGAFGKVNLALHKLTQKFTAVKSINKQYLSEEAQTKKVMQEVVILKRTRHRNIVRLYEFFETHKHILFVIELCAGGDLLNYVRRRRRLKEDVAKAIFKQIIEGLGYCHSKSILHRDIKLDNILLDAQGEVKICDFGVSKIVKRGEVMTEQCGTPAYIAPEILRDKGYEGFQVDVWSAGVVLYAMLYGTVPFKANNMSELQKLIIKAKYTLKDDISEESRDLLKGLLEKDPVKRLTISQVLQHKWLQNIDETIELFTEQEKDYIKNEFTYNDTERYNRNETDPFTEHMLDSAQDSFLKNCTSKSVILAPFNSTKSNLDEMSVTLSESMKEMMQSKRCIKFAARVRDIDRQYEMNNNADLDNGVYHKVEEEEEEKKDDDKNKNNNSDDSLQSSFNKESSIRSEEDEEAKRIQKEKKKKKKPQQTELEKLESLIYQQEEQNVDNPYGNNNEDIYIRDQQQQQMKRSPRLIEKQVVVGLQSAQTLIIDEGVVAAIEGYGYPRDYLIKSLNNNELNYATTSYYLLQSKNVLTHNNENYTKMHSTRQLQQQLI